MTNFEILKNSDIDIMANTLATLIISALSQVGLCEENDLQLIVKESQIIKSWLKQEEISGKYLN